MAGVLAVILTVLLSINISQNCSKFPNSDCSGITGKTFWDYAELLIIPATLAIVIAILEGQERKADRNNVRDNQREMALQNYFNEITTLVLEKGLKTSTLEDDVREIAHVKTLTILERLDGKRKGKLTGFLYRIGLITCSRGKEPIIIFRKADLIEADLSEIDLNGAVLRGAVLRRAVLRRTDLSWADLEGADLNEADLYKVDFLGTHLEKANLKGAYLEKTYLEGAFYDQDTIWTDGFDPQVAGAIFVENLKK